MLKQNKKAEQVTTFQVWQVKLGNMYFVSGLLRNFEEYQTKEISCEFTTYKKSAWLFPFERDAYMVAERCGGIVEEVEISHFEHLRLKEIRDAYFN